MHKVRNKIKITALDLVFYIFKVTYKDVKTKLVNVVLLQIVIASQGFFKRDFF